MTIDGIWPMVNVAATGLMLVGGLGLIVGLIVLAWGWAEGALDPAEQNYGERR